MIYFETEGKNKGCWVMPARRRAAARCDGEPTKTAKVIVRSNGTVTYVGKDIAYQLWKFGLLGQGFRLQAVLRLLRRHECWISTTIVGVPDHPHFGGAQAIYNVIDIRQIGSAENVVAGAAWAWIFDEQADRYTHFSYEMVALTPRCALELGYELSRRGRRKAVHRGVRPQGIRREGRRPARQAD